MRILRLFIFISLVSSSVYSQDVVEGWVEIDGKIYKEEYVLELIEKSKDQNLVQSKGWVDVLTPIAKIVSNSLDDDDYDAIKEEKAERINIKNNKAIDKQLTRIRKQYEKGRKTWMEYMFLKSHLLQMPIEEVVELEIQIAKAKALSLQLNDLQIR